MDDKSIICNFENLLKAYRKAKDLTEVVQDFNL